MTLQEAKEQIAKEKGYEDSSELIEIMTGTMSRQFAERAVLTEAAKLYAKSQWNEAIEAAAESVTFATKDDDDYDYDHPVISKQSILKLKK